MVRIFLKVVHNSSEYKSFGENYEIGSSKLVTFSEHGKKEKSKLVTFSERYKKVHFLKTIIKTIYKYKTI